MRRGRHSARWVTAAAVAVTAALALALGSAGSASTQKSRVDSPRAAELVLPRGHVRTALPARRRPPIAYKQGTRPRKCISARDCVNRRVEVFLVTVQGTQITTWTQDDAYYSCWYRGGGKQVVTFETATPQPAAIWVQRGVVISAPGTHTSYNKGPANRVLFAGPTGKTSLLFKAGYQGAFALGPGLAVRYAIERTMEIQNCLGDVDRGTDCGRRDESGTLRVWLRPESLRTPRPFILWGGALGVRGGVTTLNPYRRCDVWPDSTAFETDRERYGCLLPKLERYERPSSVYGRPFWVWTGASTPLVAYDDEPDRSTCLTGASPVANLKPVFDCKQRQIVVRQPGWTFTDSMPDQEFRDQDGWSSTTTSTWTFTFRRVGCGKG